MELLVVIAIIGILVGLLLPAVQAAREAARRTQCLNNLKQIGIGVHGYHDTFKEFPPLNLTEHKATWLVLILPFMEEQQLYDLWDVKRCFYDQQNPLAREQIVDAYLCPSRNVPRRIENYPDGVHREHGEGPYFGAGTDYAAATSSFFPGWGGNDYLEADGVIVLAKHNGPGEYPLVLDRWWSQVKASTVTDGLSNTFMVTEWPRGMAERVPAYSGDSNYGVIAGRSHLISRSGEVTDFNVPGSEHPGVCHFLMADASARPVNIETSGVVLEALTTRAGGEIVQE